MIKVDSVVKYFGKIKAIDDISFEVGEAENVVLLGTSGCGKTTTLRMINRLIETSSGTIEVDGKNIKAVSNRCGFFHFVLCIQIVYQQHNN